MEKNIVSFNDFVSNKEVNEDMPSNPDAYGKKVGVSSKLSHKPFELPEEGPIGDILSSAYANLNVPTRKVAGTKNGNLGCAAAVSLMFYRATGFTLSPGKIIELSTSSMWRELSKSKDFQKITNWKTDHKPGDIILTSRGRKPGHVGIVVDKSKVISNSSGGFRGDKKGQIEMNYSIKSWASVAKKNPTKTACFRYIGPYKKKWTDEGGVVHVKKKSTNISNVGDKWKSSGKLNRRYYKIWDKEHHRVLVAKYKKETNNKPAYFKVYTKHRDKIGDVHLIGGKVMLKDKAGERDVTEGRVGQAFIKLFKLAGAGVKPNGTEKTDVVMDQHGDLKHSYKGEEANNINILINEAKKNGITNPHTLIAFLSVIGKETHFIPKNEYSYSGTGISRLRKIFTKTLKHLSDQEVLELRKNDVAFYDVTYGHIAVQNGYHTWNNKANDPVKPGDGYKYRGRGFNQVTFKQSYKKYAKETGVDILNNPDKLNDINVAAEVAVLFLLNRLKQKNIDPNSFTTTQEAIDKCAAANAGWGKNPSRQIASSTKIASNFSIASSGNSNSSGGSTSTASVTNTSPDTLELGTGLEKIYLT